MTTDDIERLNLRSADPVDERLSALADLFPEAMSEGTVDFDALRRSLGEWVDPGPERFGLTWPGKADCMKVIQEPSIGTLVPMPDESVDWDTTENVIIEGENLEVLKLLQKAYYGKVKLIYIDPPYNTGKEFIYPDNFKEGLADYLKYSGQVDDEGLKLSANAETDGRYHSKWLSMMYPRLFLARNLLREDGVIAVTIGDHEVHHLRSLMAEIFGEENFVANIAWQKKYTISNDDPGIASMHDHVLVFRRSSEFRRNLLPRTEDQVAAYRNPDNDPRGPWISNPIISNKSRSERPTLWYPVLHPETGEEIWPDEDRVWRFAPAEYERLSSENRLYWGENGSYSKPRLKRYLSEVNEGVVPRSWWTYQDVGSNDEGQRELVKLFGAKVFSAPKPTRLIRRLLEICVGPSDLVLDFFAGSGAAGHAVVAHNHEAGASIRYIMVQLPEPIEGGEFGSIASITRERLIRVAEQVRAADTRVGEQPPDVGFRAFRLSPSNFTVWDASVDGSSALEEQLAMNVDHVAEGSTRESMLTELLLKAGFPLTAAVLETQFAGVDGYSVADGALVVCLSDDLTIEAFEAMVELDPAMILVLDKGFGGSDQLKVNALQTVRARNQREGTDIALRVV